MLSQDQNTCVSFEEFKKSLGSAASNYTDEQIERMLVAFDRFADVFFDHWLEKINAHNVSIHEPVHAN